MQRSEPFDPGLSESFRAPSGIILQRPDLDLIRKLCLAGSIRFLENPVELNSGRRSRIYANIRFWDNPYMLALIGRRIAECVQSLPPDTDEPDQYKIPCLVGIPTAGTPLAMAAVMSTHFLESPFHYRIMREKVQETPHGLDRSWAGPPSEKHRFVTVENVSTQGVSIHQAAQRMRGDGHDVDSMHHIIVMDRGGKAALVTRGYDHSKVHSLFNLEDTLAAAVHLKLHPPGVLDCYLSEQQT
jgi:orotate phosphoribosyltransferase